MINPFAVRILMPLAPTGALGNLFTALQGVAPQLGQLAASATELNGLICDAVRISLPARSGRQGGPKDLSLSLFRQADTRLMAIIVDDTMAVQREQQGLSRMLGAAARLDALTGLPNRLAIIERLQLLMQRASTDADCAFAVFLIRCDRLMQVNDAFGRAVGDALLILLTVRLRSTLRMPDYVDPTQNGGQMVAHINEGDFIVLLEGAEQHDAAGLMAKRFVDVLSEPYLIGPGEIHCAASIGVVLRETAEDDADAVLQDASIAMIDAQNSGGGRYVIFHPAMHLRATQRGNLEADLRRALTKNQLFVVYQTVVGMQGPQGTAGAVDRTAGVEALVRWQHPTRGTLSPDAFIGIAEECGLIEALGKFVLRTACHQFVLWQARLGPDAPQTLAVNMSRGQLGQAGLVSMVKGIIQSTGIAPARLQVEVTESLAAQSRAVQSCLRELKALGLTLALDDFGTGYSSLSSLHQLPVDTVKIDRSFVTEAPVSARLRAMIDATVRVAHALNMTVVAEGIENEAQARVIHDLGCDKGQGYFFSRPLLSIDLVQWLASV